MHNMQNTYVSVNLTQDFTNEQKGTVNGKRIRVTEGKLNEIE